MRPQLDVEAKYYLVHSLSSLIGCVAAVVLYLVGLRSIGVGLLLLLVALDLVLRATYFRGFRKMMRTDLATRRESSIERPDNPTK